MQGIVTLAASQNESLQTLSDEDYETIRGIDAGKIDMWNNFSNFTSKWMTKILGIASVAVPGSVDDSLNCRLAHECKTCHQEVIIEFQ